MQQVLQTILEFAYLRIYYMLIFIFHCSTQYDNFAKQYDSFILIFFSHVVNLQRISGTVTILVLDKFI